MYRALLIQIGKGTVKEANTLIYNFIWNGTDDKIKRLAPINDYENGGQSPVKDLIWNHLFKLTGFSVSKSF